jgi:thioredoxin-dependent peroxiredoxin
MYVDDGVIRRMFIEDNIRDNPPGVGLEISDADAMLAYLKNLEGH